VTQRVLVTGAGGRIGQMLRPRLARPWRVLRLLDSAEQEPAAAGEAVEVFAGDLTDAATMAEACRDVDAVVHLGAIPRETEWAALLRVNIDGTRTVLEAARRAGVRRAVLASSAHAAGFYHRPGAPTPQAGGVAAPAGADGVPADVPPRPDTYYGVSKVAVEALGSLYADRFGMDVFALRIGACFEEPGEWAHGWLSPDDCSRLVDACLTTRARGFRVLWGVSRNTRRWWSLAEGEEIGYHPVDDAEAHVPTSLASALASGELGRGEAARARTGDLIGGTFCTMPLGEPR
jgi:nucleoside-diphosphate-sugar epimerase